MSNENETFLNWPEIKDKINNPFVICIIFAALLTFPKEFYSILTHENNWVISMDKIDLFSRKFFEHLIGVIIFYFLSPQIGSSLNSAKRKLTQVVDKELENRKIYTEAESEAFRQEYRNLKVRIEQEMLSKTQTTAKFDLFRFKLLDFFQSPQVGSAHIVFDTQNMGTPLEAFAYNQLKKEFDNKNAFDVDFKNEVMRINLGIDLNNYFLYIEIIKPTIPTPLALGNEIIFQKILDENGNINWNNLFISRNQKQWKSSQKEHPAIKLRKSSGFIYIEKH